MISTPSIGSSARKSTPAPTPGVSADTFTQKVHAIDEVDVRVAAPQEERAVAIGLADVRVAACVARHIRLAFDDAAARAALGRVAHERLADEKSRERRGIVGQLAKS